MKNVDTGHIRNVVLAGHAGTGKTTLAEHMLHAAGAITRVGRVDDGTASLDFEPEEQKRKLSLSLAVASLEYAGHRVTLVDTPGYADFVGEMIQGFAAVDAAVITMDASGEVEAGTELAFRLAQQAGIPALFVITRCERENADPGQALDRLRDAFGVHVVPLQAAIGSADHFAGHVDLVHRRAWTLQGGKMTEGDIPGDLEAEVGRRPAGPRHPGRRGRGGTRDRRDRTARRDRLVPSVAG